MQTIQVTLKSGKTITGKLISKGPKTTFISLGGKVATVKNSEIICEVRG